MHLIFGSSGFIGSHLFNFLQDEYNKNNVIGVRKKYKDISNNIFKINLLKRKELKNILCNNFNVVYILAADSRVILNSKKEEKKQIITNRKILKNILDFCKSKKINKIIFLSSSTVYSNKKNTYPLNEDRALEPKNNLGKIKLENEYRLRRFSKITGINVFVLRLFTIYGPGMRKDQFIYQVIKKFNSGKSKLVFWNKHTLRNFIFINDFLKIIKKILLLEKKGFHIINVGSTNSVSVQKVILIIKDLLNKKVNIVYKKSMNNFNHIVDLSKLNNIIKKFRFTNLRYGLRQTLSCYVKH